ncbi:MAG: DinB family protein [Candidatus Acidiferrum sp.]
MTSKQSPVQGGVPEDLQAIADGLDKSDAEAREVVGGLNDAQVNWQPNDGAWSIAQCLAHLAMTHAIYTNALRDAVQGAGLVPRQRAIQPGWFGRYFIRTMDAPPRRKFTAPKKIVPQVSKSGAEVLADFLAAHQQTKSLVMECAELDLNRIRFKNPFIGVLRFTVGTGLLVMAAHDRRHLWQARQVRASLRGE